MKLSKEIKLISREEAELLNADKLSKHQRIETGYYLLCDDGSYTAFDWSERQGWLEMFGKAKAPRGHKKEFDSPLKAIDWLLETRK